ncbi:hypothetical protein KKH36_04075 [Patescibacteria group bacterium]|nr:hypothetical protein [Patescibacteria group bacterium]
MDFILNLRNKPEKQKRIILFFIVGLLMFFVFNIWFSQFKKSLKTEVKNPIEDLSSVVEIKDNLVNSYKDIIDEKEKIEENLQEIE